MRLKYFIQYRSRWSNIFVKELAVQFQMSQNIDVDFVCTSLVACAAIYSTHAHCLSRSSDNTDYRFQCPVFSPFWSWGCCVTWDWWLMSSVFRGCFSLCVWIVLIFDYVCHCCKCPSVMSAGALRLNGVKARLVNCVTESVVYRPFGFLLPPAV